MSIEEEMEKPQLVEILNIEKVADETYRFQLACPEGYEWGCGTNTHVAVPDDKGVLNIDKKWVHHYSVSNFPSDGFISFTTRIRQSNCSHYKQSLSRCKPGDHLAVYGFKSRIPFPTEARPTVLVSMGVGITSFRTIVLKYFENQNALQSLVNLNIDRSGQWIHPELNIRGLEGYESIRVFHRVQLFEKLDTLPSFSNALFYIVGSDEFLLSIAEYLAARGVDIARMRFDKKPKFIEQLNLELSKLA